MAARRVPRLFSGLFLMHAALCVAQPRAGASECDCAWLPCPSGYACETKSAGGVCVAAALARGAECQDRPSACGIGLRCVRAGFVSRCEPELTAPAALHEVCGVGAGGAQCAPALYCGDSRCVKRKGIAEQCYQSVECQRGLVCTTLSYPVTSCSRLLALGERCEPPRPYTRCGPGLACHGAVGAKTCRAARRLGADCEAAGALCEDGLACDAGEGGRKMCKTVVFGYSACDRPLQVCEAGFVCNNFPGKRGSRECAPPSDIGERCLLKKPCKKGFGLACIIKRGSPMFGPDSAFPAFAKEGVCLSLLKKGDACGNGANIACGVDLMCRNGVCVKNAGIALVELLETSVYLYKP